MTPAKTRAPRKAAPKTRTRTAAPKGTKAAPSALPPVTGAGTVLLTGATGTVGALLAHRYLAHSDAQLVVLVRAPDDGEARTRWASFVTNLLTVDPALALGDSWTRRVIAVAGDVTAGPDLGLARDTADQVTGPIRSIIHAAANTKFSQGAEEARLTNTQGTANVLAFADRCASLDRLAYISTVFVAGMRTGLIKESEHDHSAGFVNQYEASKYAAEDLVTRAALRLPASCYRLSTLLGDSRTGLVHQFNALHQSLKLLYHALAPMLPGAVDAPVDLVPSNYVADGLFHLIARDFVPSTTYHLCSGAASSLPLGQLLDRTMKSFSILSEKWASRRIARPEVVDLATYRLFEQSVQDVGNDVLKQVVQALSHFAPQLTFPKNFDRTRARKVLDPVGIQVCPTGDYLHSVLDYCLRTRWGGARGLITQK